MKFNEELMDMQVYVLPVQHRFLFKGGIEFDNTVKKFFRDVWQHKK